MSADSGWRQRKVPLRAADERAEDEEADDAPRRRRNRVSDEPSEASSSDEQDAQDYDADGAIDRLLREDDSGEEDVRGSAAEDDGDDDDDGDDMRGLRVQLGLEDDDAWNAFPEGHHLHQGVLNLRRFGPVLRRGHEIALHLANAGGIDDGAEVVDLQDTQNDDGQEIDLTALSSDSEGEAVVRGVGGDDDEDDEVEIVGSNAAPVGVMQPAPAPRGGLSRKRRRQNDAGGDAVAANRPFDTQRAESTNISLENNETVERFKAALKCSVCLEVIEDMTSTICGHVYCAKCIRLAIRVTHKCPLCQRPLRPTDIHGLFF